MAWHRIFGWIKARGSLRSLARWCFLGTLVIAPWLYGGTTAESIEVINGMLGVALVLWIGSLLVDRRWPLVPRGLVLMALGILIMGWWMVLNAHAIYDSTFGVFIPLARVFPGGPGSADQVLSLAWMLRASLLLGAVCLTAEMIQRPVWLLRLWCAIAVAGGSIALLGLLQKGTDADMIFWQPKINPHYLKTFFATYFYHANAGAFLNLVLPVAAGLVLWEIARQARPFARAIWTTTLLLIVLAILSNTSRMAQAVGLLLVLAMSIIIARPGIRMIARAEKRTVLLALVVVVLAAAAIAQAARLEKPLGRWQEFSEQWRVDARWPAKRAALNGVGEAGWFGFGPGTFRATFPRYQESFGDELSGSWRFLHDDYLQTVLEWGWAGSALMAALFFGGIGIGIRNYFRAHAWSNRQKILLASAILALAGVALHALVDFPLQILSIQLFAATYLGICWGSVGWNEDGG